MDCIDEMMKVTCHRYPGMTKEMKIGTTFPHSPNLATRLPVVYDPKPKEPSSMTDFTLNHSHKVEPKFRLMFANPRVC